MQFDKSLTREGFTFKYPTQRKTVDMMTRYDADGVEYGGENSSYHWVSLPYKNEEFEMTIVMPRSHILVSTETEMEFDRWFVQQIFSASKDCSLSEIFSTFPTTLSELGIPKFKMDFSVMLSETLRRPPFNMKKCLAPGAEFSEMVHESSNLFISEVIHKAYIDVNEVGVISLSATTTLNQT